jgi:hypothetical protein
MVGVLAYFLLQLVETIHSCDLEPEIRWVLDIGG